jgi:hypothetical protein
MENKVVKPKRAYVRKNKKNIVDENTKENNEYVEKDEIIVKYPEINNLEDEMKDKVLRILSGLF